MTLSRPATFIAKLKSIFGVALSLFMFVAAVIPGTVKTTSKVNVEIEKSITTQATEVNFTFTNKSPFAIDKHLGISAFEKKVGDEWVACADKISVFVNPVKESFIDSNILVGETFSGAINFGAVLSPDGHGKADTVTLESGEYRITFSYSLAGSSETSVVSCVFTVAEA